MAHSRGSGIFCQRLDTPGSPPDLAVSTYPEGWVQSAEALVALQAPGAFNRP